MLYCYIKDNAIGSPTSLPRNWGNISNFYLLAPEIVATYGWFPCHTSEKPAYDESVQRLAESLQLVDNVVVQSWEIVDLTPEERLQYLRSIRSTFDNLLEQHMTEQVSYRDYKSVDTAIARWKGSSNSEWRAESEEVQQFIDSCYQHAYSIENAVLAGTRPIPTEAEFLTELPRLGWEPPAPPDNGNLPSNGTI